MRAVISIAALSVVLGAAGPQAHAQDVEPPAEPSATAPASNQPSNEPSNEPSDQTAQESAEDTAAAEKTEAIQAAWGRVFAPPQAHRWEFGLAAGWLFDETAFGDTQAEGYVRAEGRRLLGEYLSTALAVDFWRQEPSADPLEFRTRHIGLTGAFGAHHWFGRWLLGAEARAGAQWINRTIGDARGTSTDSSRVDPSLGAAARAGLSVFGVVSLTIDAELRWRPQRLDRLIFFQVGWLTGWDQ